MLGRTWRHLLWVLLTAMLLMLQVTPLGAGPDDPAADLKRAQEKEKEILRQKQNAQGRLNQVYLDTEATKARLGVVEHEIAIANGRIQVLDVQLKANQAELDRLQAALKETDKRYRARKEQFNTRLRAIHEQGRVRYLQVLLESTSWGDFITRMELLKVIIRHDAAVLTEIRGLKAELDQQRGAVANRQAELSALQAEAREQKQTAEAKAAEIRQLGQSLAQQKTDLLAQIAAYEREQEQVEQEIYEIQRRMARAAGKFTPASPLRRRLVNTSAFGPRIHPVYGGSSFHGGTDFDLSTGDPVLAIEDGVVIYAGWDEIYGNRLVIDHGGGIASWYGHLLDFSVKVGAEVQQGQVIARGDSTGLSTGPHLHLEIRVNNQRQDPMKYLTQ